MSEVFSQYLNRKGFSDEAIEMGTRAYLSEITDDLLHEDMRRKMQSEASGKKELDGKILSFADDPKARRDACLAFLSWAWEDEGNRERLKAALEGTQGKLPVIEVAILAIVAMYGMYLLVKATREKPQKKIVTTCKRPDGTFITQKIEDYGTIEGPMGAAEKLFGGIVGQGKEPE